MLRVNGQQRVEVPVPALLDLHEGLFFVTPTFFQVIMAVEVIPFGNDTRIGVPVGTVKSGAVRLKITLMSGAVVELDPNQADTFLTMIGARQKLVEVPLMV